MRRRGQVLTLLVLLTGVAACDALGPRETDRSRLDAARAQWAASGITSYEYQYQGMCIECQPIAVMTIRVVEGAAVTAHGPSGEDPPDWFTPPLIPDLFDRIEDAIGSGRYDIQVTYDAALGYPLSATFAGRNPNIADDFSGFTATDLSPLES